MGQDLRVRILYIENIRRHLGMAEDLSNALMIFLAFDCIAYRCKTANEAGYLPGMLEALRSERSRQNWTVAHVQLTNGISLNVKPAFAVS